MLFLNFSETEVFKYAGIDKKTGRKVELNVVWSAGGQLTGRMFVTVAFSSHHSLVPPL